MCLRRYPGLLSYGVQNGPNALPSNPPQAETLSHLLTVFVTLAPTLSPLSGWVGFGIAESGAMKGADIVYFEAETMKLVRCISNVVCACL